MDLVVEDLAVARGGLPVLAEVTFSLTGGAAMVLRGPNGAGKTTLLRTVAGLQPPLSGRILGAEDRIAYAGIPMVEIDVERGRESQVLGGCLWDVLGH